MSDITFRLTGGTNVGLVRTNNEDNFIVNTDLTQTDWFLPSDTSKEIALGELGCLFVVADGMGGMNAGEVASAIAIDSVKEAFSGNNLSKIISSPAKIKKFLQRTVETADSNIKAKVKEDKSTAGMGTTIVIGWVLQNTLHISWCGDSRAYLFNPSSGLIRLSKDHSYVQQLVDAGKLDPELAFDHPNSNIITRSLGDSSVKALPDYTSRTLFEGDLVFLCSDGLCGLCRDEEMLDVLNQQTDSIEQRKSDLITAALEAGGHDNVTVVMFEMVSVKEDESSHIDMNTHNDFKKPKKKIAITGKQTKIIFTVVVLLLVLALLGVRYLSNKSVEKVATEQSETSVSGKECHEESCDIAVEETFLEDSLGTALEKPISAVQEKSEGVMEEELDVERQIVSDISDQSAGIESDEKLMDENKEDSTDTKDDKVEVESEDVETKVDDKERSFFKEVYDYLLNKFQSVKSLINKVK